MATIRPILGELAGSIAGNTFSHNRGGLYVKRRANPVQPDAPEQLRWRTYQARLTREWSELDPARRKEWNAWAAVNPRPNRLGDTITLSGHNAYCGLNARMLYMGYEPVASPPAVIAPQPLLDYTATITTPNVLDLTAEPFPLPSIDHTLAIWATLAHSAGATPNARQARLVALGPPRPDPPTSFTLRLPYPPLSWVTLFIEVWDTANGLASPPLSTGPSLVMESAP